MPKIQRATPVSFSMRARVPESVHIQELEGEAVILNLASELYLGLNPTGTEIFNELSRHETIQEAYESLLQDYEIEPETLHQELSKFLEKLLEQGLIELSAP